MFGYVKPVTGELLVREHDFYRAVYCGICQSMKKHTGRISTLTLTYDSVFYALVRMMLADESTAARRCRCLVHPCRGKTCLSDNPTLTLTARAFSVLAYGKLKDGIADRRGFARLPLLLARPFLRRAARRANLPELWRGMESELSTLFALEVGGCVSIDRVSDCSGRLLARFFAEGLTGEKREIAEGIGFHLGRFIAMLDAARDLEEDIKKKNYNPLCAAGITSLDAGTCERMRISLTLELSALEEFLLRLPCEKYEAAGNILKNILYLGLPHEMAFLGQGEEREVL